jgi:hypothetical protein
MQITAHVYSDGAEVPAHVGVLPPSDLPRAIADARGLLRRYRRASRVELRVDGGLMFTFLAPPDLKRPPKPRRR